MMNNKTPVFLIVEDHPEVAENNCYFLNKLAPKAICITVDTAEKALVRLKSEMPSLAVIDLQFTTIRGEQWAQPGLDLLEEIFVNYPNLNILIYTSEYSYLNQLINPIGHHLGGFVVVSKLQRRNAFIEGAKNALNGQLQLPRELRQKINLNKRDLELLELLCKESLTDKAIASRLNISLKSVQNYVQRLKVKLDIDHSELGEISARVELCMEALRRKLITLS
jgi:DNA-binding NarL/FixJ family response regulator